MQLWTGKNLRHARLKAHLDQKTLADKVNIHPMTISRYETGEREPRVTDLQKIAAALGISVAYLMGETEEPVSIESAATDAILPQKAAPKSAAEKKPADTPIYDDKIETMLSLLYKLSSDDVGFSEHLAKAVNKNTSIAQLTAVVAQIWAYLSELDPQKLAEPDRRTLSDLLAACQRIVVDGKFSTLPNEKEGRKLA